MVLKYNLAEGINLHHIKENKFKTTSLGFYIHNLMTTPDIVTKNAIIPLIIKDGSKKYKTARDINIKLEELYGTQFSSDVYKKGENQIINFNFDFIKYTPNKKDLLADILKLAENIILNPLIHNNEFLPEYISVEQQNLKNQIDSLKSDKRNYSVLRCYEEMCKGEPFSISSYGSEDEIYNLKDIYAHYKNILLSSPIDIFLTGEIKDISPIQKYFSGLKRSLKPVEIGIGYKEKTEVLKVIENLELNQGKICIGFRTNIEPNSPEYYSLVLYNSILGSGAHSKLFNNVREKYSLAYYISSRVERFKGLMVISGGVNSENFDKATEEIFKQMEEIKNGNIKEFEVAKKSVINSLKSLKDSAVYMQDFYLNQILSKSSAGIGEFERKINSLTIEDVMNVSDKLKLDTIYTLR